MYVYPLINHAKWKSTMGFEWKKQKKTSLTGGMELWIAMDSQRLTVLYWGSVRRLGPQIQRKMPLAPANTTAVPRCTSAWNHVVGMSWVPQLVDIYNGKTSEKTPLKNGWFGGPLFIENFIYRVLKRGITAPRDGHLVGEIMMNHWISGCIYICIFIYTHHFQRNPFIQIILTGQEFKPWEMRQDLYGFIVYPAV